MDVEPLVEGLEESEDQSALLEYLSDLKQHPLDLNKATAQQLSTIPWISPIQAIDIIKYRYNHGNFTDVSELLNIRGVAANFDHIKPFVSVKRQYTLNLHVEGRHRAISKLEVARGYKEHIYLGSPYKLLNRLNGSAFHAQFGLLTEKDPGEKNWDDLRLGYVELTLPKFKSHLILGNFSAAFGQGLVFWGPYNISKGSDAVAPAKQRSRGLYRYLSVDENSAYYGAAAEVQLKPLKLTTFYSRNAIDSAVNGDSLISMPTTGYHRLPSEWKKKDRAREHVLGLAAQLQWGVFNQIGITLQHSAFSHNLPQQETAAQHDFYGVSNSVLGLNYDVTFARLNGFGEIAQSKSGGKAALIGWWWDFDAIEWVLLWRGYDDHFQNFHALGFGESRTMRNETGTYLGIRYRPGRSVRLSWFVDVFRSSWPKYRADMPSSGYEMMARAEYAYSKNLELSLRGKFEKKLVNASVPDQFGVYLDRLGFQDKLNVRLQSDFLASKTLKLRSRLEVSSAAMNRVTQPQDTLGTLLFQDISWKPSEYWHLQSRWTFFDAPLYELRFYQYENDLPGVMRLKMLYGRGTRWYVMAKYAWSFLQLSVKFERTWYQNRDTIGSGYDLIESPSEHTISLQLDWRQ